MSEITTLPWTFIFRATLITSNMILLAGMLWVRAEIRKELEGYVTKHEFATYQEMHKQWGDEVVKGIRSTQEETARWRERIEGKIDRITERIK